jgi:succinate dehydrogenase/fumarate reductase flavoprotein subunit
MSEANRSLNRRSFVAGAAALVGAGAVASACPWAARAAEPGEAFENAVEWDAEYDVVVVGLGGAGCAASIEAADAGSRVLVLEKAPEAYCGGNSAVCFQWIAYAEEETKGDCLNYFKELRGGWETPSDEILEAYVDAIHENYDWLQKLGAPNLTVTDCYYDFPDFPGSDSYHELTVDGVSGFRKGEQAGGGGMAYNLVRDNVLKRSDMIDVWYETPATHLIQDPDTKVIHGVVAEVDGEEKKVRAKNGVVLACGGFENNPEMQQNYFQCEFWPSLGEAYWNEGDGINMALEVGARLWHMSNRATQNYEYYNDETKTSQFCSTTYGADKGIYVGTDGSRVYDGPSYHGKVRYAGEYIAPFLPCKYYYLFDQGILDKGQIGSQFSDDLAWELEHGYVTKGESLEDLGGRLGMDSDAVSALVATVDEYNGFCDAGYDPVYHRTKMLTALRTPPFYAMRFSPITTNTQGGPEKDANCQVLDVCGNPIPHLYEAGELGDIWSNLYQAGNNFGGGLAFGRVAGRNASRAKDDVTQESLVSEGFSPEPKPETEFECGDNQYIGHGKGKGQVPMTVRVTMDGDKISSVEVLEHFETVGLSAVARGLEEMPKKIVDANGTGIDITTGATRTGIGLLAAVDDALSQVR